MANIKVTIDYPIANGLPVTFKSPADCSQITGLVVSYPSGSTTKTKTFQFADAHGNNVGSIDLFASNVLVKVILDVDASKAYVQNADTNAYLEAELAKRALVENHQIKTYTSLSHIGLTASEMDAADAKANIIKIFNALPARSELWVHANTQSTNVNLGVSIASKLTADLGIGRLDYLELRFERVGTTTMYLRVTPQLHSTTNFWHEKEFECVLRYTKGSIENLSPFIQSRLPSGFYGPENKPTAADVEAAPAADHRVKSYTALSQIGLTDTDDMSATDAKSNFLKIFTALGGIGTLVFTNGYTTSFAKSIFAKLTADVGDTMECWLDVQCLRTSDVNLQIDVVPQFYSASNPRPTNRYSCVLRYIPDGTSYLSPFVLTRSKDGFFSRAGDTIPGAVFGMLDGMVKLGAYTNMLQFSAYNTIGVSALSSHLQLMSGTPSSLMTLVSYDKDGKRRDFPVLHVGNKNLITAADIGAAPAYTYGEEDIEAGSVSTEPTGTLHFVIE